MLWQASRPAERFDIHCPFHLPCRSLRALCFAPRLGARFDRVHHGRHVGLTVTQLGGLGVQVKADIQQRRREIRVARRFGREPVVLRIFANPG